MEYVNTVGLIRETLAIGWALHRRSQNGRQAEHNDIRMRVELHELERDLASLLSALDEAKTSRAEINVFRLPVPARTQAAYTGVVDCEGELIGSVRSVSGQITSRYLWTIRKRSPVRDRSKSGEAASHEVAVREAIAAAINFGIKGARMKGI